MLAEFEPCGMEDAVTLIGRLRSEDLRPDTIFW